MGRGEHERHEVGRLLERLEERVPGVLRDLVGLVEDVDLAPKVGRGVIDPLAELADRVDAAVRRGVDLDEVERPALADRDAGLAGVAGIAVLEVRAVERLGEDPRERGLAGAARPDEEDRVRDPAGADGVPEGFDDGLLADDLGEGLGSPASVERLVRCGRAWARRVTGSCSIAGGRRKRIAVHPPSICGVSRPPRGAARTRPFRGTRRGSLSAASFRT